MDRQNSSAKKINDDPLLHRGKDLMISISGIRGTLPRGLDTINILHFARAFAAMTGKRIVIGNDARPTGPILRHITLGVLLAAGKEIIDIGLAPTPTVKAAVRLYKAHGGIMFSASHNPLDWNAFKFMGPGGFFFDQEQSDQLLKALHEDAFSRDGMEKDFRSMGTFRQTDAVGAHIDAALAFIKNQAAIKRRRYRVVVDAVAGAGREALPRLLERLGCRVIPLFCEPTTNGRFPRPPEPTPKALRRFAALVKEKKADIGFALDPDADRLVVATPSRGALNEEYTLPLAFLGTDVYATAARGKKSRPVVVNLSTADLLEQVAASVGIATMKAAVGEANVVALMRAKKSCYGGEGNGGIIHPDMPSYGRDPIIGVALILSAMAGQKKTADELMDAMPPLYMEKRRLELSEDLDAEELLDSLERSLLGAEIDRRDGLHMSFADKSWLHMRKSNTEPIVRLIGQARSAKRLKDLLINVGALLN